jgi:hypothetical protein
MFGITFHFRQIHHFLLRKMAKYETLVLSGGGMQEISARQSSLGMEKVSATQGEITSLSEALNKL